MSSYRFFEKRVWLHFISHEVSLRKIQYFICRFIIVFLLLAEVTWQEKTLNIWFWHFLTNHHSSTKFLIFFSFIQKILLFITHNPWNSTSELIIGQCPNYGSLPSRIPRDTLLKKPCKKHQKKQHTAIALYNFKIEIIIWL